MGANEISNVPVSLGSDLNGFVQIKKFRIGNHCVRSKVGQPQKYEHRTGVNQNSMESRISYCVLFAETAHGLACTTTLLFTLC